MGDVLRFKRGLADDAPALMQGEPGFATDSESLFIGGNDGNVKFINEDAVNDRISAASGSYIFNMEYLQYFHNLVRTEQPKKILWSGDSRTSGFGIGSAYVRDQIIDRALRMNGVTQLTTINNGVNGGTTDNWINERLDVEMAMMPDLWVIDYGFNDADWPDNINTFETKMTAALTTIRSSRDGNELSIILCSPTACNEIGRRDATFLSGITKVTKKLAKQFHCCYIDFYHYFNDPSSVVWADSLTVGEQDNVHIHPLETANLNFANLFLDAIYPRSFNYRFNGGDLTLLNSWIAYNSATYGTPRYSVVGNVVQFYGAVKDGITVDYTDISDVLPLPYRPGVNKVFSCATLSGTAVISVTPDGKLRIIEAASNAFISLEGIRFNVL